MFPFDLCDREVYESILANSYVDGFGWVRTWNAVDPAKVAVWVVSGGILASQKPYHLVVPSTFSRENEVRSIWLPFRCLVSFKSLLGRFRFVSAGKAFLPAPQGSNDPMMRLTSSRIQINSLAYESLRLGEVDTSAMSFTPVIRR